MQYKQYRIEQFSSDYKQSISMNYRHMETWCYINVSRETFAIFYRRNVFISSFSQVRIQERQFLGLLLPPLKITRNENKPKCKKVVFSLCITLWADLFFRRRFKNGSCAFCNYGRLRIRDCDYGFILCFTSFMFMLQDSDTTFFENNSLIARW